MTEHCQSTVATSFGAGDVVALTGTSGPGWVRAYSELLASGATIQLLDPSAPPVERDRWTAASGATHLYDADRGSVIELPPPPGGGIKRDTALGSVLISSSGTSGAPKVVARSVTSLNAEGRRHVVWSGLGEDDHVVIPLPLWHAYALGWLHAAFEARCQITALPPTSLTAVADTIRDGGTVLALVPSVARLLAARGNRAGLHHHRLRLAMAGAGQVDSTTNRLFRSVFGIGLARDYGSTETGSLFSATEQDPLDRVGHALDGVRFRVVGEDGAEIAAGQTGELWVAVGPGSDASWHRTGDIVSYDPELGLGILGRKSRSIRRGDRWISPDEVESVLRDHSEVLEARVRNTPADSGSSSSLSADVVMLGGVGADTRAVHEHAKRRLAPHKVPEVLRAVGELPRGRTGKPLPDRALALAEPAALLEAVQSYKRGELLFALRRLGVLELLRTGPADSGKIAAGLGLDPEVCDQLLNTAEACGLLRSASGDGSEAEESLAEDTLAVLDLESHLSRSWVTRERLSELCSTGMSQRAFDVQGPDDELIDSYQRAMHPPTAYSRARTGLALSRGPARRLLEITCGPGRYVEQSSGSEQRKLLRVGTLSGDNPSGERFPEPVDGEQFDLVVVCNAIHLSGPGSDLRQLARRLVPGGRLLIDDVFMDTPGGLPPQVRLDWLTHGGSAWPTEASLLAGLSAVDLDTVRTLRIGDPAATLIMAEAAPREEES